MSAIPLSLAGLLLAPSHRLNEDVLALHLGKRRHERNHHLAHLGFAVDAVLDIDEVRAKVLHELKRREGICRVTPETAQLEHEDIINVDAGFYLFHHLLEVRTPRDVLARVAIVYVLVQYAQVLTLHIRAQVVELRFD